MARVSILLLDDHEMVEEGLKAVFGTHTTHDVVTRTDRAELDPASTDDCVPDVVIVHATTPASAAEAATVVRRHAPERVAIVVVTSGARPDDARRVREAGADHFLTSHSRADDLLRAVGLVATGDGPHANGQPAASNGESGRVRELSRREEEILRLVANGNTNKEIAATLGLSVKTVETHKTNASQKLGLKGRSDIVRLALERGWFDGS